MGEMGLREVIVARDRANGLDAVGICEASPFTGAPRTSSSAAPRSERRHGVHLPPQPRALHRPSRTLAGARSLVVGAVRYASRSSDDYPPVPCAGRLPGPSGRSPATVGDQDQVLRRALDARRLGPAPRRFRTVVLSDDNALVDRAAAHRAGIGWFGKSANLLLPGRGAGSCSARC